MTQHQVNIRSASKLSLLSGAIIAIIGLYLAAAPRALAFYDLSPDSQLFVTATTSAAYNDNLFLSNTDTKSDTEFDVTPGLQVVFGQGSVTTGAFSYGEDFQFFGSDSNLDAALALIDLNIHHDDGITKINVTGWFHQADQATREIRETGILVHRDLSHFDVTGENELTAKTSLSAGVVYDDTAFAPAGYHDWQWIDVPVHYYYKVDPDFDVSGGFTFRNNQISGNGLDSDEYFYNIGVRGTIAPKLTTEFSVGYVEFDPTQGRRQGALGLQSTFSYALDDKTTLTLQASNQYGYAVNGDPYRTFGLTAGAQFAINSALTVGVQAYFDEYSYLTTIQHDNFGGGQLSATYALNKSVSVSAAYAFARNSSNIAVYTFSSNILSVSATFRY